ncbi:MAG TPA: ABC transporter ATP-binding protein [Verrucomicrobiae bacterium]|jgi:ATP-binding cassette subfamily B protein
MQLDPIEKQFFANHPWRTLLNLYRPERRWVASAVIAYLFKASPVWVLPVVTANIVDIIAHRSSGGLRELWINAGVGAVMILQNVPTAVLYVNYLSRAVRNVEIRLRSALVRRLQMLSISYHNRTDTGTLQTKVLRDVESVQLCSQQLVDVGLFAIVSIIVSIAVTAWRMPVFVPVFIVFVPFVWLVRRFMTGKLQRRNELLRRELETMNSLVLGMINMIPITRAHAVEAEEIARLEDKLTSVRTAARSFDKTAGLFGAVGWVVLMLFNLAGLTVGAWLSYEHILPLTPGDLVLLAGYFNTILTAVMQLNTMLPILTRGLDGLRSIGEVLECPDIEENRGKQNLEKVRGEFRFENVEFTYNRNNGTPPALQNFNLFVSAGEAVGIVGPSGSGKSTFISLVMGFHRPTTGRILLDGVDMNEIDLRTFRRHLAVVSQQTILFNGTLRENIIYGTKNVSEDELRSAIASANAQGFVGDLPKGLDTEIGASGVQLSGGQRQRIAIARALLRNPSVLILDEPTSALDAESEIAVQQALERLMEGRTTFIITHQLSVLRKVKRKIGLEQGQITDLKNLS